MNIESLGAMPLCEIEKQISEGGVLLMMGGDDELSVASVNQQHGVRAAAIAVIAYWFVDQYGDRLALQASVDLWEKAAKKSNMKKAADKVAFCAQSLDELLAWGGCAVEAPSIECSESLSPDELLSLGNFLALVALKRHVFEDCTTSQNLAFLFLPGVLQDILSGFQKSKKGKNPVVRPENLPFDDTPSYKGGIDNDSERNGYNSECQNRRTSYV